jgi:S1-C subfamily serine protease
MVGGASGAPMIDANGRVTGMLVMGEAKAPQGYSLSMGDIRRALPQLRKGARQDSLGVDVIPLSQVDLNSVFINDGNFGSAGRRVGKIYARYARILLDSMKARGMYVNWTSDNSPAYRKIFSGDVITHVNGVRVSSLRGVCGVLESTEPGSTITVRGIYLNNAKTIYDIGSSWTERVKLRG